MSWHYLSYCSYLLLDSSARVSPTRAEAVEKVGSQRTGNWDRMSSMFAFPIHACPAPRGRTTTAPLAAGAWHVAPAFWKISRDQPVDPNKASPTGLVVGI